ncbi:ATP-NAD kinase-like domain-containing protein [Cladochytrium replicatum]|nr:ATP-NAD kinase-like domain-containing protein [Cladochytrium replicatum]
MLFETRSSDGTCSTLKSFSLNNNCDSISTTPSNFNYWTLHLTTSSPYQFLSDLSLSHPRLFWIAASVIFVMLSTAFLFPRLRLQSNGNTADPCAVRGPSVSSWWFSSSGLQQHRHVWVPPFAGDSNCGVIGVCTACSKSVSSPSSLVCLVCGRRVHSNHQKAASSHMCKRTSGSNDHQWIPLFPKRDSLCSTCGENINTIGRKCAWCQQTCHSRCTPVPSCPLGPIHNIVIPPSLVSASLTFQKPPGKDLTPLLCFINPKSGTSTDAPVLLTCLYEMLNPCQVVDLSRADPAKILRALASGHRWWLEKCRVVICGGDGTVGWVLSLIEEVSSEFEARPPSVAIIPMGTGNDLARVLGWGGGWSWSAGGGEEVARILEGVVESEEVLLDRWVVEIEPLGLSEETMEEREREPPHIPSSKSSYSLSALDTNDQRKPEGTEVKRLLMSNYLSIGADAGIALDFHRARESKPHYFRSRLLNKVWYALFGGKHVVSQIVTAVARMMFGSAFRAIEAPASPSSRRPSSPSTTTTAITVPPPNFHNPLEDAVLRIFNHSADDSASDIDSDSETDVSSTLWSTASSSPHQEVPLAAYGGLIVLNIPSYGGGHQIHRVAETDEQRCRFDDAELEILGVANCLHVGASLVGITAPMFVGKATGLDGRQSMEIVVREENVAIQVDGEPWVQKGPCVVRVRFYGKARMLKRAE